MKVSKLIKLLQQLSEDSDISLRAKLKGDFIIIPLEEVFSISRYNADDLTILCGRKDD